MPYFASGAAKSPFRLGHKMEVLKIAEEDVDRGVIVKVREKGQTGCVPLSDLDVKLNLRRTRITGRFGNTWSGLPTVADRVETALAGPLMLVASPN